MLAVHCYQNDSYEITINGLQARKLWKYKRNFRFPAMGNLLQRKLKWDSYQEVSQQLSKDFKFEKDFIEISELSSNKNSGFH